MIPRLPLRVLIGALAAITLTLSLAVAGPASAGAATLTPPMSGLAAVALQTLRSYVTKSSPTDTRYFSGGTWFATDGPTCWYCYDSAAAAAAVLSTVPGGDTSLTPIAVQTIDTAIAQHQTASGAFLNDAGQPDAIATDFFVVPLGLTYLQLQSQLDPTTKALWSQSIARAADYIESSGNANWYINGNLNLRQTEVFWLAWAATGAPRFLTDYDAEWNFTIAPPQSRWPGFGLHYSTVPSRSDGSDGAGYLAESGGGTPGFDPSYTQVQLDTASDLYVLTQDPRYVRLMNLLFDQLRPLINSSWFLDATHGTRKNDVIPFDSPGLDVLAASGDRPDLVPLVSGQVARVEADYAGAATYTHPNYYKGFAEWIAIPLLAADHPGGVAPDARLRHIPTPAPAPPPRPKPQRARASRTLKGSATSHHHRHARRGRARRASPRRRHARSTVHSRAGRRRRAHRRSPSRASRR